MGLLSTADNVGTPGGLKRRPSYVAAPFTTFFCLELGSQSVFTVAIRVMESEYLTSLKNAKFDEIEGKLQGGPMIYKGIKHLCGDPTPLRKKVEDYRSVVLAFL